MLPLLGWWLVVSKPLLRILKVSICPFDRPFDKLRASSGTAKRLQLIKKGLTRRSAPTNTTFYISTNRSRLRLDVIYYVSTKRSSVWGWCSCLHKQGAESKPPCRVWKVSICPFDRPFDKLRASSGTALRLRSATEGVSVNLHWNVKVNGCW
jgi:hypothetical protein